MIIWNSDSYESTQLANINLAFITVVKRKHSDLEEDMEENEEEDLNPGQFYKKNIMDCVKHSYFL